MANWHAMTLLSQFEECIAKLGALLDVVEGEGVSGKLIPARHPV